MEGAASGKALWQGQTWWLQGTDRRPEGPEGPEGIDPVMEWRVGRWEVQILQGLGPWTAVWLLFQVVAGRERGPQGFLLWPPPTPHPPVLGLPGSVSIAVD